MNLEIAHPYFLIFCIPILILLGFWKWFHYKKSIYLYSSTMNLGLSLRSTKYWDFALFFFRMMTFLGLILSLSRLRAPDLKTKIPIEGINIMMVLDVSLSMNNPYDIEFDSDFNNLFYKKKNYKTRFKVAQEEAIKFIDKRENDQIGLVLFGRDTVFRCPLTYDRLALKNILKNTFIGEIDGRGTSLSRGILTAINRLKNITSDNKIIIALTDGQPTEDDIKSGIPIDLAKKLGIKIYTIGIGKAFDNSSRNFFYNFADFVNVDLLEKFSKETGGQFYLAQNSKELNKIYEEIDQIEKSEYEKSVFSRYYEYFTLFLIISLMFALLEIFLTFFVLKGIV